MPEAVRCDVCGKLFSSRHVKSHKRLAHTKHRLGGSATEQDKVKTIRELYETLSAENQKSVLEQLAALEQEPT